MRPPLPHPQRMFDRARFLVTLGTALALAMPVAALADSGGGRSGNANRLRPKADSAPVGRTMRRPTMPEPKMRSPWRLQAAIPDPSPHKRGGKGLERRGRYFDETMPEIRGNTQRTRQLLPPDPAIRASKRGR